MQLRLHLRVRRRGVRRPQQRVHVVQHLVCVVQHRQQVAAGLIGGGQPGVDQMHRAPGGGIAAVHGVPCVADGDGRRVQKGLRPVHHVLQRYQHGVELRHLLLCVLQSSQQVVSDVLPVPAHGLEHRPGGGQRVRYLADDGGVDLLLHGGLGLAGDLGRDGVLLLVLVILYLRVAQLAGQNADEIAGELVGHYQRGIVLAGLHTAQSRLRVIHEHPAHLVVALQALQDQLTDVHVQSHHLAAVILAGHRHLDAAGGGRAVGVPVGQDVEPGVQAGH